MKTSASPQRSQHLPSPAEVEARLPLIRRIAIEIDERLVAIRRLNSSLRAAREDPSARAQSDALRVELGTEQAAYLRCLVELSELDCDLELDFPITIHVRAQVDGEALTLCWVIGESHIGWHHPPGASPGSARQPLPRP